MNAETKHLMFEFHGLTPSGKTSRWVVKSQADAQILGWIEWHAPWRRYWYAPINGTAYDAACLTDIASFLSERMGER